jgi:hypothetical protein
LITFTRKLARQVHDVFRRGLPKTVHGERPTVVLQTDRDGFRIRACSHEFAIEFAADLRRQRKASRLRRSPAASGQLTKAG